MKTNQLIALQKRNSVLVTEGSKSVSKEVLACLNAELASLGFIMSDSLQNALSTCSEEVLSTYHSFMIQELKVLVGANKNHKPLFGNFPIGVEKDFLTVLQQISYLAEQRGCNFTFNLGTEGEYTFETDLKVIDLTTETEVYESFVNMVRSNVSVSKGDRELISSYMKENKIDLSKEDFVDLPNKENMATFVSVALDNGYSHDEVSNLMKTATDVLRVATGLSGGDVSLKEESRFKLKNSQRKLIMSSLDKMKNPVEDMLRYRMRWIRLAEVLHTGSYKKRFPNTFNVVQYIRENEKVETFNTKLESGLLELKKGNVSNVDSLVDLLKSRPGEFARRLDFMLQYSTKNDQVSDAFIEVLDKISTNVLLQVRAHIANRSLPQEFRYFLPKGSFGKMKFFAGDDRRLLSNDVITKITEAISDNLSERFGERDSLGKVFVNTEISKVLVPMVQRDTQEGFRTIPRGSRVKMDDSTNIIQPFIWWQNEDDGNGRRVDVDLSVVLYNDNWDFINDIAYYNVNALGNSAQHSGDKTDAPGDQGASEFVCLDINEALNKGVRYIAITINNYTGQCYDDFNCFAGFQERDRHAGNSYDPRTVKTRFGMTGSTKFSVPLIVDLENREMIWADLSLSGGAARNARTESSGILACSKVCQNMFDTKPKLVDLLEDHFKTRATEVVYGTTEDYNKIIEALPDGEDEYFDTVLDMEFAVNYNDISANYL